MSTDQAQQAFVVPPLFDASSTGDCILSTPDGAQFKVHRAVMGIASPVFADMFNIPQGGNPSDDIPVIAVTEDPKTLATLLTVVYPVDPPVITDFDVMLSVVEACEKYSITMGRLRRCPGYRELMMEQPTGPELGLRRYALAWKLGLKEEAKIASRYLHKVDLKDRSTVSSLLRESGSLDSITELWDLRLRRDQALNLLLDNIPFRTSLCSLCGGRDYHNVPISFSSTSEAWYAYRVNLLREQLREALTVPYPRFIDIGAFLPNHAGLFCDRCPKFAKAANFQTVEVFKFLQNAIHDYPQEISGILFENRST